jgi:hypothetical protein
MTWFFDFSKLMKCSDIRHDQLEKEKKLDERLQVCNSRVIREYLFAYRKMNRSMSNILYTTPLMETPQVIIEQLDKIEQHLILMDKMKECSELPDIIKGMN